MSPVKISCVGRIKSYSCGPSVRLDYWFARYISNLKVKNQTLIFQLKVQMYLLGIQVFVLFECFLLFICQHCHSTWNVTKSHQKDADIFSPNSNVFSLRLKMKSAAVFKFIVKLFLALQLSKGLNSRIVFHWFNNHRSEKSVRLGFSYWHKFNCSSVSMQPWLDVGLSPTTTWRPVQV